LSLRNPEEAIARVALRVEQGGHNVPADVVRRRFVTGMKNFMDIYRFEVDYWRLFDNSGTSPVLLSQGGWRLSDTLPDSSDPDMQSAPQGLRRAAQRAREVARSTRTGLVIVRDGVLIRVPYDQVEDIELPENEK